MGYVGIIIVILVLLFCVGLPLLMITAFLFWGHHCGTNIRQDSDDDNSQTHVTQSLHLSTTLFNQHRVRPPVPSIPNQVDTIQIDIIPIITATGLNHSVIQSLPSGPIGEKVLMQNPGIECSICLAEYCVDDIVRRLPCTHAFHLHCIDQWLKDNLVCPICKNNLKHLLHPSP